MTPMPWLSAAIGGLALPLSLVMIAPSFAWLFVPAEERRIETVSSVQKHVVRSGVKEACREKHVVTLSNTPDTVIVTSRTSKVMPQGTVLLDDFGTVLHVEQPGVIDVTLKVEAKHRGNKYSEVIGFGIVVGYQYAPSSKALDLQPVIFPDGWVGGTNIRDLSDHYGQVNIVSALNVKPGFYRLCVYGSAHSSLTDANDLAEVLVEHKTRPMNTMRLSFKPGGKLIVLR
jgi:hypothetical protein